jgi:acyl-CoA thioesterase FadM
MLTHTLRIINSVVKGYLSPPKLSTNKAMVIPMRCWPIDVDPYMHMNNSKYLLIAELARWRSFPATGLVHRAFSKKGLFFILAECEIKYMRQINPFQKFVISTTASVGSDDKWIHYRHDFLEHPDDAKGGEQQSFAVINAKFVMKQNNGKTIKPSSLLNESEYLNEWMSQKT